MKKRLFSIILLLVFLLLFCQAVYADGMAFKGYDNNWDLLNEEHQLCYINYENGKQNMILSIDVGDDLDGEEAVWLFPVPSNPKEVDLSIIKGFPIFMGMDINYSARSKISETFFYIRSSQIYPVFNPFIYFGTLSRDSDKSESIISESIREMGLATDLVSSSTIDPLIQYLKDKGFDLDDQYISILDSYIGEDYSFVVSWIYDIEEFKKNQESAGSYSTSNTLAVELSFPAEKLYFPLKPTSAYGDMVVPATIYVTDFVSPKVFKEIKYYTDVNYYRGSLITPESLNNGEKLDVNYTKIQIDAPANMLKEDLWIDTKCPSNVKVAIYINENSLFIYGIILFLILSLLSGLITHIAYLRKKSVSKFNFLLLSLGNILGIIGVFFASKFINSKRLEDNVKKSIYNNKSTIFKSFKDILFVQLIISIMVFAFVFSAYSGHSFHYDFDFKPAFLFCLMFFVIQIFILSQEKFYPDNMIKEAADLFVFNFCRCIYLTLINIILPLLAIGIYILLNIFVKDTFWYNGIFSAEMFLLVACLNIFSLSTLIIFDKNISKSKLDLKCLYIQHKNDTKHIVILFSLTFVLLSIIFELLIKLFI
ncbi:hypothetical protein RBH29_15250 [Herbivorax sp. ANBcel31]|uniref:hypothetical protein n=1 Tax=Herbivorax sp. ANBcel31 TaxID=3069754 RepID=UPI0027B59E3E|nr:hypothetical protein [Herbivorax sp. ANBcel31]MDQ2087786.1 hypothetical protein [Herbivorax sp. ANBcel31]